MMETVNKFSFKNYWERTPKLLRKLGDSMLACAVMAMGYSFFTDNKSWLIWIGVVAIVGKFLTNFFAVEKVEKQTDQESL